MKTPGQKSVALFIAVLAGFLTPFDLSAVTIALPAIGSEFSMDAVALTWVSTAYLLAAGVFLVPFGRVADICGRKKIFVAGLFLFIASSFLMVFSSSTLMVILLRIMQGSGAALVFGTSVAILTEVTPVTERGKALGIYTTAVYLGLSLGPFIGGFLTTHLGWRSIFLVNVPVGIAAIALILLFLNGEWAESRGERYDLGGAIQYGLTLVCVMYGFSLIPDREGFILLLAGAVMFLVFIARELRIGYPLLSMKLFTENHVFAFSGFAALINYASTFSIAFFLSLYLQYVRGFPASIAGTILVVQPVMQAVFSPWAGWLSDRIEPGTIASAGMAILALGLFILSILTEDSSIIVLIATLALLGFGFALFSSPNTNAIMSSVEKKYLGIASGTLGTMRLVGQMLSMGIATMIIAIYVGRVEITPLVHGQLMMAMRAGFTVFSLLSIAGIFFSLTRGRLRGTAVPAAAKTDP
ncbi:MAG TPA: MFS transporter [Methanoregula sp.]|nr:MFS transporter [Methanoregula sp.]